MKLTNADILEAQRELSKRSLAEFSKLAWHVLEPTTELKWGWALDAICEHLEAVTNGDITRLLMNVPPGSMKSLLTGVIWPAWEWGPRGMPEMRFVGTAHEQELAIRDSRKCRDLIKSEWYQSLWDVELLRDLDGKREFGNTKKGIRQARAFTSMTGVRGDRVILDDPISADNANSEAKIHAAEIAFTETLPTRVNSEKSAIVVIMQRLNEGDTSGIILDKDLDYCHLVIPMRYEAGRGKATSIGWVDPRTTDGELMFPERFGEKQVVELEKTLGPYASAGQLQQRPAPRGGGIFKDVWWKYWKILPSFKWRAIYADTAQKTKEENDYSVFQCWGTTESGEKYLIDQLRGKWEAPELLINARAFWNKHKATGPLRAFKVEDKVSGTGLIQSLARENIPVEGIKRNIDKVTRAHDAAPVVAVGSVYLPERAEWLSDFLKEAGTFPNGKHDDQLDPMFDAVIDIDQSFDWSAV